MRVIVSGSRDWIWRQVVEAALLDYLPFRYGNMKIDAYSALTVIHGGARGADQHAKDFAFGHVTEHEEYRADWTKYGKAAGPIRNQQMVDLGADVLLAFRLNESSGTTDCMERADKAGIPVILYDMRIGTWTKPK